MTEAKHLILANKTLEKWLFIITYLRLDAHTPRCMSTKLTANAFTLFSHRQKNETDHTKFTQIDLSITSTNFAQASNTHNFFRKCNNPAILTTVILLSCQLVNDSWELIFIIRANLPNVLPFQINTTC